MKNQKGITLVALVVTIIVLLILAGVSISLVVGQNGVLTQAQDAVLKNQAASVREKVSMALGAAEMKYTSEWAMNQAVTRAKVFNTDTDASGIFQSELTKDGVVIATSASNSTALTTVKVVGNAVDYFFKYDGNTYKFKLKVDETTGKVSMSGDVTVYDSKGTSKGTVQFTDSLDTTT